MTPTFFKHFSAAAAAAVASIAVWAGTAAAIPIPLFNTGTDATNTAWGAGNVPDIHYFYTASPLPAVPVTVDATGYPIAGGPWVANNANSRWIGPDQYSYGPAGGYTYATQFVLPPNTNLATVNVSGMWATDDPGLDIEINNISTGQLSAGFTTLVPFSITGGFQVGVNTIEFLVQNAGGPTGLRVDKIRGDYSLIPEPGTLALATAGLIGIGTIRRRRRMTR
jgi:hypothetical protein